MPGQMFLRTALTEQRITDLEEQVARIMDHLQLTDSKPPPDPDDDWEAAAPKPEPIEWKAPNPSEPPKQSKIAQKVAKRK